MLVSLLKPDILVRLRKNLKTSDSCVLLLRELVYNMM